MQALSDDEFEVILVNDGTRDNSFSRIADIIKQHSNIIVMEQENQGLSAARNTGLTKATGQYVLFLDSDDVLVPDSIKPLVSQAMEKDADLLIAGFEKVSDKELQAESPCRRVFPVGSVAPDSPCRRVFPVGSVATDSPCRRVFPVGSVAPVAPFTEKTGHEAFLHDLVSRECYVWRTFYKKAFLDANNLRFIPGIYFEDVPFTTECYLKAGRCLKTDSVFYLYRQREQSICSSLDARKIYDLNTVMACLWDMREHLHLSNELDAKYMDVIFTTFSITQWYIIQYDNLFHERRQLIADLKKKVPNLQFTHTRKQRVVSLLFRLMPCNYIWLRRTANRFITLFK